MGEPDGHRPVLGIDRGGPSSRHQQVTPPLARACLRFAPVIHEGNSQSSKEEACALRNTYQALIGRSFRDRDGKVRAIGAADILIVKPYNAQVNLLTRTLPAGARIGTVDKFQGQEAPV